MRLSIFAPSCSRTLQVRSQATNFAPSQQGDTQAKPAATRNRLSRMEDGALAPLTVRPLHHRKAACRRGGSSTPARASARPPHGGSMTRAAVMYNFFEPLKVESLTVNPPREDEVVVKLAASGVCHTDLSVVEAKLPVPPPVVLGHEGAGSSRKSARRSPASSRATTSCCRGYRTAASAPTACRAPPSVRCGSAGDAGGQEFVFEKDGMPIARMAGVASFAERTVVRATAAIRFRTTCRSTGLSGRLRRHDRRRRGDQHGADPAGSDSSVCGLGGVASM